MSNERSSQPADALLDPAYRTQVQGLADMTAALNGTESKPVVFSTDADSIVNRERCVINLTPITTSSGALKSISDDDLCSTCQYRNDGAGDLSTCALDWPGKQDEDSYVRKCAKFSEEA